jgi:hypothetical protein
MAIVKEIEPFVKDPAALAIWSKEFFLYDPYMTQCF